MKGENKTKPDAWFSVKIRNFFKKKISKHVGPEKESRNQNDFVNQAVKEKLDRLEITKQ